MKTGINGINLIKKYEGIRHKAYLCPANIPTIGYGTTIYPNGQKVKLGDLCTSEQATEYLTHDLRQTEQQIGLVVKSALSQNQFDALVSFTYNLGIGNLTKSTLLKKINLTPYDPSIMDEFLKWNKAGGRVLQGLTNRRKEESQLYFKL